ncbi:MAG: RNA polymerase sigma factor [Pseudomonadales bacterium]
MAKIIGFFQSRAVRDRRFEEIVRPHLGSMYRVAYRWVQNRETAEDLVQEALVKVINRVDEMTQLEKPGPWLIKILYRCFVDFHRKHARTPAQHFDDWRGDFAVFDEALHLEGETSNNIKRLELQRDLLKGLETLNDDQREVVLLHDSEGYSATEVASILGISDGTVKSRLHRARTQLKKVLDQGPF